MLCGRSMPARISSTFVSSNKLPELLGTGLGSFCGMLAFARSFGATRAAR